MDWQNIYDTSRHYAFEICVIITALSSVAGVGRWMFLMYDLGRKSLLELQALTMWKADISRGHRRLKKIVAVHGSLLDSHGKKIKILEDNQK